MQINEIRKTSLARIICDNTDDVGQLQPRVMMQTNMYDNCPVSCNSSVIDTLDMNQWVDTEPTFTSIVNKETLRKAARISQRRILNENQAIALRTCQNSLQVFIISNMLVDPASAFSNDDLSPLAVLANTRIPKREALDISKKSRVLLEMTKVLLSGYAFNNNNLQKSVLI